MPHSDTARGERRISIAILAIGGQGGGVLADWLVDLAEEGGWLAQATSVPGVAQRTGATIYYVELFPRALAEAAGREPVLALMPTSGDVDVVVAAELMEAGRAMQRGLVTPDRTTLIASSHRSYAILEKSALGNGIADPQKVHEAAGVVAKRYMCFDMAQLAEAHGSVISAALFGAIAGAAVLPFRRDQFEASIRRGGVGVEASLAAFAAAFERAAGGAVAAELAPAPAPALPGTASDPRAADLLRRIDHDFPEPARAFLTEGVRRLTDYLDVDYAAEYVHRMERIAALEDAGHGGPAAGWRLTRETARYLALWMAYEDVIRVADLKTRGTRFAHFRGEVRAAPDQVVHVTEFLHPRVEEIADTLPAGLGRWLLVTPWARSLVSRWFSKGRLIRTATLRGFLTLYAVGRLRGYRRRTLRFEREHVQIEGWLAQIRKAAAGNYALACEIAECARVLKGYSETYERGRRNFTALMGAARRLDADPAGAAKLARLRGAALQDEDGVALAALARELALAGEQASERALLAQR